MAVTILSIPGTEAKSQSRGKIVANFDALKTAVDLLIVDVSVLTLTYATTVTTDASAAGTFDLTLTGPVTLANPTNPVNGMVRRWRIKQDATGSRAVTLGAKFSTPSSITVTFSTTAGKTDFLEAMYNLAADKWQIIRFVAGLP